MTSILWIFCTIVVFMANFVVSAPPHVVSPRPNSRLSDIEFEHIVKEQQENQQKNHQPPPDERTLVDLGIEYNRYLREVVETLEKDEAFKKKLETAGEADIRTGKIADELDYVGHHIRSKLDELKRQELNRLRDMARRAYPRGGEPSTGPGHVNHENPHSFEKADLIKLIEQVAKDLADADQKRKQMFKEYEMQKHFEREQKLKQMTDEERTKFLLEETKFDAEREVKHKLDPIHHPGSKKQLEEVWEKQDEMEGENFNPRTFFAIHDIDGNGFWDEEELKALFVRELDKLYKQGMAKSDLMEKAEEMERMREHVFKEVDLNQDRLISWEEFQRMSEQPDFEKDEGWKTIDQNEIYTSEELRQFENQRQQQIDQMIKNGQIPQYPPEYYQHHPNMNNPTLNHGYPVNNDYPQPQHMGYPQQPNLGEPQHNQQFANQPHQQFQQQQHQHEYQQQPPQQQYQQLHQQQYQQPPQQQQPQEPQQPKQPQQFNQQQDISKNAVPQQPAQTEQKSKDPQVQQSQGQQPPSLQQYAPGQQKYQAVNSDSIKTQNAGRLNDVNSNQMLKNKKESYGKSGHINKSQ